MQDFRRHEGRRSDDLGGGTHRHQRAEVDQLGVAVAGAADVSRAYIAMQQAARVEQCERRTDLQHQRADPQGAQRRKPLEVAAIEQLHGVEGARLVDPVVIDIDDARVA